MFTGAQLRNEVSFTEEEFNNITSKIDYDTLNLTLKDMGNNETNNFIVRGVGKYADFLMFFTLEGADFAMKFGYSHPEYNYNLAWKLMFITMFAVLIFPLIILLMFIGFGIYYLVILIKKIFNKMRHKK